LDLEEEGDGRGEKEGGGKLEGSLAYWEFIV
jgi:hypothetical protein